MMASPSSSSSQNEVHMILDHCSLCRRLSSAYGSIKNDAQYIAISCGRRCTIVCTELIRCFLAVLVLLVVVLQARVDIASVRMLGNDSRARGVCVQQKNERKGRGGY